METTRLSSKGQVIIPQSIRATHHWGVGVKFAVIDTAEGLLLTPISPFKSTSVNSILGCTGYKGSKKSLKDMEQGIIKGVKKQK